MKKKKEKICFLRGALMHAPLPISQKMNKKVFQIYKQNIFYFKLASVLGELNITSRPLPTAENEELYDQLREQILIWFTLQKHLKKKENVSFSDQKNKNNLFFRKNKTLS